MKKLGKEDELPAIFHYVDYKQRTRVLSMDGVLDREWIERRCKTWNVPGMSLYISHHDKVLQNEGFGLRNIEQGLPVDTKTRFCIASCTKSFTTALALMLQEEGYLDIDKPIRTYIPDFEMKDEMAGKQLCLRDIFLHRSGLATHEFTWPSYDISDEMCMKRIRYLDMAAPFRSCSSYNNVMYCLAGYVESVAADKPWSQLVKEKILVPLKMDHTYISLEEAWKSSEENLSLSYRNQNGKTEFVQAIAPKARSSGSIVSTAEDLGKWLEFQMNGRDSDGGLLLSEKSRKILHSPQVVFEEKQWDFERTCMPICYGLGWFVREYHGLRIVYHHGATLGFCSLQAYIEEEDLCISILMNLHGVGGAFTDGLMFTIIDKIMGFENHDWLRYYSNIKDLISSNRNFMQERKRNGNGISRPLQDYLGDYWNDGYGLINVRFQNDKLQMNFKDFHREMYWYGENTFRIENMIADTEFYILPVTFLQDIFNAIAGLKIPFDGQIKPIYFQKILK